jgi:hypothetical protein
VKEVLTRRELFKEMVSKDTIKQVASAWYGFSNPLTGASAQPEKKESLFEKVQRLNTQEKNFIPNGKEG